MFRRRQVKTQTQLMRDELGESFDHLRMAAAHAAEGASGALAPRMSAARRAVKPGYLMARTAAVEGLDSVMGATREGSRQARKLAKKGKARLSKKERSRMARKRWSMMIGGLLASGAAIGAASALMKRRRSTQTWDEYAATRTSSDTGAKLEAAKSTMEASMTPEASKERESDLIR